MEKLALLGGKPVLPEPLSPYRSIGDAEEEAVAEVMRSGCLSGFYGTWGEEFFGGPRVQALERAWGERFQVPYAISVNSATSGLYAAMGAIGLSPGEEVILPAYTMSATAMAPLLYGGIPVFADIDPETFCLDPEAVCEAITPQTRAILAVNLFGHPAPLTQLKAIAKKHNLYLIEDNAQSPLAEENQRYTGAIGDIGIFSLNYHKHLHTGEGGICVTRDDRLAQRLQLIRNHGENAVEALEIEDLTNLIGFNYRMTEMSAAVGIEQLKQIDIHVNKREHLGQNLSSGIADLEGLNPPPVRPNCRHVYYVWAMRFDEKIVGISRQKFSQALKAEGFPHFTGYVRPLYFLPVFQKRIAIGNCGFPFTLSDRHYDRGLCPVTERMYEQELLGFEPCAYAIDSETCDRLIDAIRKVYNQRHLLIESARDRA